MPKASANSATETLDQTAYEGDQPEIDQDDNPSQDDDLDLGFARLDDTEDKLNILYYGREGSGKTTDALDMANSPDAGRILVINVEGGLKKDALRRRGIRTDNVLIWPDPKSGVKANYNTLMALHRRLDHDLQNDPNSWYGVVFDSITEIAAVLRENATERRQDNLRSQGRSFDETFIDVADYGVVTDQASRVLRRFRDLPCHFVATALERVDEVNGVPVSGPALGPALANNIAGYVDFVLFTKASQISAEDDEQVVSEFRAATRSGARWRAKDRFDVLPRVLADPTFTRVHSYTSGELVEEDDALQAEYMQRQRERAEQAAAEKAAREAEKAARKTRK